MQPTSNIMTTFSFSHDKPLNTFLNQPDGHPLYNIETPFSLIGKADTTVSKVTSNGVENIGTIRWHHISKPEVTLRGSPIVFMPSDGMFSKCVMPRPNSSCML